MFYLYVILSCIAFLLFYLYLKQRSNIPGPFNFPGFGILPYIILKTKFSKNTLAMHVISNLGKTYGPVSTFYMGTQQFVLLSGYKTIKEALVQQGDIFSGRPNNQFFNMLSRGQGLILSQGKLWQDHRRFALRVLKDFGLGRNFSEQQIQVETVELVQQLSESGLKGSFNPKELLAKAVVNVIAQMVFNERSGYEDSTFNEFLHRCKDQTNTSISSLLAVFYPVLCNESFLNLDPGSSRMFSSVQWILDHVQQKIDVIKQNYDVNSEPTCYIESYLQEVSRLEETTKEHNFTEFQLRRSVFDLYLAGSDTTTNTLGWLVLYAAVYPDKQDLVFKEIAKEIGSERDISMADKKSCHYAQAFIDEGQRLSTLVPTSVDHRVLKDHEFHGYVIPSDALIYTNIYGVHHDHEVFSEPNKFKPERFLDLDGTYCPKEELIQFNIGKRSCLGEMLARMEVFIIFTSMIQRFRFELDDGSVNNLAEILTGTEGIIHAPGDYKVRIFDRNASSVGLQTV